MSNITFMMIKPDATEKGHIGSILEKVTSAGFIIKALKLTKLTKRDAEKFYEIHKERPFFDDLIRFMTRGPIVAAILEKNNAVVEFRNLIGSTDPSDAENGTIRKEFAESKAKNAIHGSDSDKNAKIESDFFFSKFERF